MALEEWNQVWQEKIAAVIGSMPWRIEACIRGNGGNNFNFEFYFMIVLLYLLSQFLSVGCHFKTLLCYSLLFGGACGC